jgi:hypothetical protein
MRLGGRVAVNTSQSSHYPFSFLFIRSGSQHDDGVCYRKCMSYQEYLRDLTR